MNLQKQLRCVYLHAFFSTLRFTDAVWVALLAARGFSLAEIGLAEGAFHLTSLLCEVPSGMAADLLGRRLIAADAVISLPSYLTSMFVQQRLTEQGGAMEWLFLPGLLAGAAGMAGTALGRRLHPKTLRGLYLACALTIGAGALLAGAAPAWACAVGPMLVQGALAVWFLHSMQRMNESISSDRRATLISVDSMTYSLLMIPASPMLGWLGDAAGSAGVGLCLLGAMVAASGLAVAAKTRYNRRGA